MTPRIKFICLLTAFALSLFYTTSATEIRQDKVFSDITYEYELQEFASGKRYAYGTFTFNVLSNGYSEAIILSHGHHKTSQKILIYFGPDGLALSLPPKI